MYTINEDVVKGDSASKSYFGTGISEVELSHRAVMSKNNNSFLEYAYTNENGQTIIHTEWEVKTPLAFPQMTEKAQAYFTNLAKKWTENSKDGTVYTPEQIVEIVYKRDLENQKKRVIEVASKFVKIEELYGEFQSYLEFITHVSNKIGGEQLQTTKPNGDVVVRRSRPEKLRVKFTYDRNGYINTPLDVNQNEPWIELVGVVPAEETKIHINPSKDKMFRDTSNVNGSSAPKKANPLEDTSSSVDKKDDMPF